MTRSLIIAPSAEADIIAIGEYIAQDSPDAAGRFLDAAKYTLESLRSMPDRGTGFPTEEQELAGMRWVPVRDFKAYLVFYQPTPDTVLIARVMHGARDVPAQLDRPGS